MSKPTRETYWYWHKHTGTTIHTGTNILVQTYWSTGTHVLTHTHIGTTVQTANVLPCFLVVFAACASAFVAAPVSTRAALKSSMVTMSSSGPTDQLTRVDAIKVKSLPASLPCDR